MEKSARILIIFLLPLIPATYGLGFEQAKVLFFIIAVSFLGLGLIFGSKIKLGSIGLSTLAFTITLLVASLLGINHINSFVGTSPYFQGWILYADLFLFYLLVRSSKAKFEEWAWALSISGSIVALVAVGQWIQVNLLNQDLPTYAGRVVSTFGQPNFYAGFLLLSLPFSFFLINKKSNWPTAIFLITILGVVLSESRTAIIGVCVLLVFWSLAWIRSKTILIVILGMTLLVGIIGVSLLGKEVLQLNHTNNPDLITVGVEKRFYIWPAIAPLIIQRPLGYGLENIHLSLQNYFTVNKHTLFEENLKISPVLIGLKDLNIDRSHNYILDLLLFAGLPGLLCWLFLVFLLFKKLKQYSHDPGNFVLMVSLVAYLIWIQFQNQSVVHLVYFWLLVGLIDKEKSLGD